ncbi:Protein of unknown function [Pyronema omphalodes CBS 100304]|uniref:Uncharacterized protein n=1 Tax=Pyronema omphalodes (strain CBS 100304) TaxID=1076935 RepID=U4LPW7_PYROM|nr:Protein of unknown function [Pyronema omphalodes CBS 100304]
MSKTQRHMHTADIMTAVRHLRDIRCHRDSGGMCNMLHVLPQPRGVNTVNTVQASNFVLPPHCRR